MSTASFQTLAQHLRERYRDPGVATPHVELNGVLDTMLSHRTVRAYSDRPLPAGLVELLAAVAQSAPSSSNVQACSIVAVEDHDRKSRLSKVAAGQKHVASAPLLLVFVADLSRLRAVANAIGAPAEALDYIETFLVAAIDATLTAQNVTTAAESLGLGCCYIGALRNDPEAVARELALPPGAFAVFGMTIGYPDPDEATGVKPRLPQSVILHRERYRAADPQAFDIYDERILAFRREQGMSELSWTEQSAGRVRGPQSMAGRHRLREILVALGFGLA